MAKYNLIRSSLFNSPTISGTGDRDLTYIELASLVDGNTTTSGVDVLSGDTLYLDVDLYQRIKVDGIFLYANDLTKLANIDFQYKNYAEESYSGCEKNVSTTYTATIPEPSAPRFIRCIISGIDINLFEFSVYNDDYLINFGADGTETDTWLDNTPIGAPGIPEAIEIYNNSVELSGPPVNAYVCVDYTGQGGDDFVKIAKSYDGTYLGYEHGTIVGHKYLDWDAGWYDNTENDISDNTLKLADTGSNAQYEKGVVCVLPLDTCYYISKPLGFITNYATTYDYDNEKIYAFFYNGTSIENGTVRLYSYDLVANTWTFISNIYTDRIVYAERVVICYYDNRIYFFWEESTSGFWYYYDLLGPAENYTKLDNRAQYSYTYYHQYSALVSDKKGAIYSICTWEHRSYYYNSLYKYTISTDTWTNMDISTFTPINYSYAHITYDTTLDIIYFLALNNKTTWIQKYILSENRWEDHWLDLADRIGPITTGVYMEFQHDNLYFSSADFGTIVYVYDISTDLFSTMDIFFEVPPGIKLNLIITNPVGTDDDLSFYSIGPYAGNYLFGYNTPFANYTPEFITTKSTGTYTTNIIGMDDPFKSSYLLVSVADTAPQIASVSADSEMYNGTIEVRSSSSPPTPIDEVYWAYAVSSTASAVGRYVVGTAVWSTEFRSRQESYVNANSFGIDRRTGRMMMHSRNTSDDMYIYVYNRSGSLLYSKSIGGTYNTAYSLRGAFFDKYKGYWWHQLNNDRVLHYTYNWGGAWIATTPSLYAMCAELGGDGMWFTETESNSVNRLNYAAESAVVISLYSPRGICATNDGGCWVSDISHAIDGSCVRRYDRDGNLLNVVSMGNYKAIQLGDDHQSGFYACSEYDDGLVWHFDSEGNKTMELTGLYNFYWVKGGRRGAVIHSTTYKQIKYIDLATKSVIWTKRYVDEIYGGTNNGTSMPDIFSWDEDTEDMYRSDYGSKILPVSYDPVWYGEDSLEWKEVPKDGYFLPKVTHHQARVTLRNYDGRSTPKVKAIAIAPTITVTDIAAQSSKPVYVRSDIPVDAEVSLFVTRLKVWWDLEEN